MLNVLWLFMGMLLDCLLLLDLVLVYCLIEYCCLSVVVLGCAVNVG